MRGGGNLPCRRDSDAMMEANNIGAYPGVVVTDGHAVLPEGMTHLPAWALFNRTPLVSIGSSAFEGCFSLARE
ncbi:hypothetical protein EMIHUDRAFT_240476 [Emiliania huxleyi CCMP1516]|uniref:Uncharacterized protein n=2 Tax=Emiliania huxleyi TaxID=2903 RepID=A0A0D3JFS8_EMIH1|nr:hypothetical protein EMIHUDRAFT_240476 [Emiliania huxleyi CCMP1516]EOD22363.1 hypothetical protein EMIHUDRAFT_240476 [Emiliania huxleyi CCMP1516]|eukprot:XP_005774792.1 hypothetical protein EMIHUDRAFT_240476 [Emiliania huxleyi CCMP1516]